MNANALTSLIASTADGLVKKHPEQLATALNSAVTDEIAKQVAAGTLFKPEVVTIKVTEAIDAKTKAGELVPKDTATQLCSAAKDLGLQEGEKKVRDEIAATEARKALIVGRKASLQTCGLPVPSEKLESVLAAPDADFTATQKLVEDRIAALQKKGMAINSKTNLDIVWLPQSQYDMLEPLITGAAQANPLVVNPGTSSPASSGPMI